MQRLTKRVLLLGWDAADWKLIEPLIEAGEMPNLERFVNEGMMGNVASLTPMLSPILWTSIATGKNADKHDILGFAEPDGTTGKCRPVTSTSRKCKAIWNILSDHGLKAGVVNWFASHPAEKINGFVVTDRFPHAVDAPNKPWPKVKGSVYPAELLDKACQLRVHPAITTQAQVAHFIPRAAELDPRKDKNVHELRVMLAQCATVQMVTTWLMQEQEWDFLGVYFDTIDRFGHVFMEYYPPKMPHVSDHDFDLYKDVMKGCYKFHDKMLGRMMQLAGDDTTIIILSDHGFHSDHLRPEGSSKIKDGRPVAWHRRYGMLAIRGPGIKKDERVYGASLLDVAPTVLWLLGLSPAKDMDGHVLTQILEEHQHEPTFVDTYEGNGSAHQGAVATHDENSVSDDPWASQKILERLQALGYIDSTDKVENVVLDRMRNLAQVYSATGRPREALEQWETILEKKPDDKGTQIMIATCWLDLGELDKCEASLKELLQDEEDAPQANYYMGIINFRRGDYKASLRNLRAAEKCSPLLPGLQAHIGRAYLNRTRWREAARAFRKALKHDPDDAVAHDGLGVALRAMNRPEEAVHQHMQSIALLHNRPLTHIHLGLALAETGHLAWAARAFNVALEQNPNSIQAHRRLAELYERGLGNKAKAAEHRRKARALRGNAKSGDG
ncbi:MAG: alkaline phosphatase family protein [Phycisphaerales bacterium]|nr:alkaline phosphatase family protein [Phycisphaerales bacterium]